MTTKKKTKKKATKAVAIKKESSMDWISATSIANTGRDDIKVAVAYKMAMLASKVFEVPLQGITILGGQPYINKTGWQIKRLQKMPKARFEKTWHHLATPTEKYAIIDVRLLDEKGQELGSATGEAAPENIKLAAVKLTLNMMAETRAKNRATSEALSGIVLTEAVQTMNKMVKENKMTEKESEIITEAARTSAEEINQPQTPVEIIGKPIEPPKETEEKTGVDYVLQVKSYLHKKGANNEWQALELLFKLTGVQYNKFSAITQTAAKQLIGKLLIAKK